MNVFLGTHTGIGFKLITAYKQGNSRQNNQNFQPKGPVRA